MNILSYRTVFLLALLAAAGAPRAVRGETYLGVREFGDPVSAGGGRSAGMGDTGVARGRAAAYRLNPAVLPDLPSPEASLTAGPMFLTEKVAESASVTRYRDSNAFLLQEATLALPLKTRSLWIGLGAAPVYDFHYEASRRFFTSTGTPSSENRARDGGALWAAEPALAWAVSENFALGASYAFWTGAEDLSVYKIHYASGVVLDARETADYRGGAPKAGFVWRLGDAVRLGAMLQPSGRLKRRYEFVNSTAPARNRSGTDTWDMPSEWAAGLSYRAAGDLPTEFAVELRQTAWSRVKVNGKRVNELTGTKPLFQEVDPLAQLFFGVSSTPRSYTDTTEVRLGVEHALTPEWSLRYGFHHQPYFADRTLEANFFTAGAGYAAASGFGWDAAGAFGKRDYKGDNLLYASTRRADETFRRFFVTGYVRW